jgi:hypothetical protein
MRKYVVLSVAVLALLTGGWLVGQEVKGYLPANYGKLGLSDEQKQKVYKIQADYKAKAESLERQLAALKTEQKSALEGVLTPAQKTKLKEILLGGLDSK